MFSVAESAIKPLLVKLRLRRAPALPFKKKKKKSATETSEISVEMTEKSALAGGGTSPSVTRQQFGLLRAEMKRELVAEVKRQLAPHRAEMMAAVAATGAGTPSASAPAAAAAPTTGDEKELPPGWTATTTPEGRVYYSNSASDEATTWVRPTA